MAMSRDQPATGRSACLPIEQVAGHEDSPVNARLSGESHFNLLAVISMCNAQGG